MDQHEKNPDDIDKVSERSETQEDEMTKKVDEESTETDCNYGDLSRQAKSSRKRINYNIG